MPATVPLTTPVRGIASARAVAESVALAPGDELTGPAVDRILRFFEALPHPALVRDTEGILDVLHLFGAPLAERATAWLAARAAIGCEDCEAYWAELHELSCLTSTDWA